MLKTEEIVINTSPLISLMAAMGDLEILNMLYNKVLVPFEVCEEIYAGGAEGFGIASFEQAEWLQKWPYPMEIAPLLRNSLDRGEASVIQLALDQKVGTVCIDETTGRRIAKLSNLHVTGSIGILLRAKKEGAPIVIRDAIARMKEQGIWLGESVVAFALREAGEPNK